MTSLYTFTPQTKNVRKKKSGISVQAISSLVEPRMRGVCRGLSAPREYAKQK